MRLYTQRSLPGILIAHRWAGELASKVWRCVRSASILRGVGPDPICHGCGLEISYGDVPQPERYRGAWFDPELEALAFQLDLCAAAKETAARDEWFRKVPPAWVQKGVRRACCTA